MADVAAQGVVGKGGRIRRLGADFPVRYKAQLDQGLETVADTENQAVPVVYQLHDSLPQLLVPEGVGIELGASLGLVAG